jgi:CheY-like chemotaxis protein
MDNLQDAFESFNINCDLVENFPVPLQLEFILVTFDNNLNARTGFDLVMLDLDYQPPGSELSTAVEPSLRSSFMVTLAKNLRLRNCAVPIIGVTSKTSSSQNFSSLFKTQVGDMVMPAFNTVFTKPLTLDLCTIIVRLYFTVSTTNERTRGGIEMYDSSQGKGLREILPIVQPSGRAANRPRKQQQRQAPGAPSSSSLPMRSRDAVMAVASPYTINAAIALQDNADGSAPTNTSPSPEAPVATLALTGSTTPITEAVTPVATLSTNEPLRMLIVEDSRSTTKLYSRILTSAFLQFGLDLICDVALDGDQAVNLVKQGNKYVLITMDIEMRNVGGIDTAKVLRVMRVGCPIVACSGHTPAELVSEAFRGDILLASIDYFIQKPLSIDSALEVVTRFVLPKIIEIPEHAAMTVISKYFLCDNDDDEDVLVPDSVVRGLMGYLQESRVMRNILKEQMNRIEGGGGKSGGMKRRQLSGGSGGSGASGGSGGSAADTNDGTIEVSNRVSGIVLDPSSHASGGGGDGESVVS